MIAVWSRSSAAARVAFVVMMVFGTFATLFVIGVLLSDPGGLAGIAISAAIVGAVVGLSLLVVRQSRRAPSVLGVATALLVLFALLDVMFQLLPRGSGPSIAVAALVLSVPLAFLGLRDARLGGWLLVAAGLAPLVEVVARAPGGGGGVHLGGSSRAVAVPVIVVGLLFLIAASRDRGAERQPAG